MRIDVEAKADDESRLDLVHQTFQPQGMAIMGDGQDTSDNLPIIQPRPMQRRDDIHGRISKDATEGLKSGNQDCL